ncbi:MAG: hypothetical protein ACJ8F7_01815 [Gemmataceae bacterium]
MDSILPERSPADSFPSEPDEGFFQQILDDDEFNHAARRQLAQWLAERGDPRQAGCEWLCRHLTAPQDYRSTRTWDWNDGEHFQRIAGAIPHAVFARLEGGRLSSTGHYREYLSRREAEDAFCAALLRPDPPNPPEEPIRYA